MNKNKSKKFNFQNRIKRNTHNYKNDNKTKLINNQYSLLTPNSGSPIGGVAKMLTKLLLNAKGKNDITQ